MNNLNKVRRPGHLTGFQRRNLAKLLDMLYPPSEIAKILDFGRRQFYRVYIPSGCPHVRGENGRLWINGVAFRQWYFQQYPKVKITDTEAYCLACKRIVSVQDPQTKQKGRYRYWSFVCPNCGHRMSKAISRDRSGHDQSPEQETS